MNDGTGLLIKKFNIIINNSAGAGVIISKAKQNKLSRIKYFNY